MGLETLFRGYVKLGGGRDHKGCKTKEFKTKQDNELLPYTDIYTLKHFGGVLREDSILIDLDDAEQAEIVFKIVKDLNLCCRVHKTRRGMHFLFSNHWWKNKESGTHLICGLGLTIDYKRGGAQYTALKIDDVMRECIYDKSVEGTGRYDEVPIWLLPVKTKISVFGLDEGDGRNDACFRYIECLYQSNRYTKEDCKTTLRLINKYVFKRPLDNRELETQIMRDSAFDDLAVANFRDDRGKVLILPLCKYLVSRHGIVWFDNALTFDSDNNGAEIPKNEIKRLAFLEDNCLTKKENEEIVDKLIACSPKREILDGKYVVYSNCIINTETWEVEPANLSQYKMINCIHGYYNPDVVTNYDVEQALSTWLLDDHELIQLFYQMVGSMMYRKRVLGESAFILKGSGSNGKSTCFTMLRDLIGDENNTSVPLNDLNKDYNLVSFYRKLTNIAGELGNLNIDDSKNFKLLTGQDSFVGRQIYCAAHEITSYATPVYGTNSFPVIKDKTVAIDRRLKFIPFDMNFEKDGVKKDPTLKDKLCSDEAKSYLINKGLAGLREVIENGEQFILPKRVAEMKEEWKRRTNHPYGFATTRPRSSIVGHWAQEVFTAYGLYCSERNIERRYSGTLDNVIDQICEALNCATILRDGKNGQRERFIIEKP